MVDFSSYLQHGPPFAKFPPMGEVKFLEDDDGTCKCGTCVSNDKLRENQKLHYDRVKPDDQWEEIQFLICPPRVLGYHLKGKIWVELDVEKVAGIKNLKDSTSFESLELAKGQKSLIKQLVACHASGKDNKDRSMTDLMQGKGNGLVILLHGMVLIDIDLISTNADHLKGLRYSGPLCLSRCCFYSFVDCPMLTRSLV